MSVVWNFAPWIVFTAIGGADWRLAAAGGVLTLAAVTRWVPPHRPDVLAFGMFVFFACAEMVAALDADSALFRWLHPIAAAWMCALLAVSVALRRPIVPSVAGIVLRPAVASSPAYAAFSRAVSLRWCATYAFISASAVIAAAVAQPALGSACTVVATGWALRATARASRESRRLEGSPQDRSLRDGGESGAELAP